MPDRFDGAVVLLTRQPDDNASLAAQLRGRAAEIVELPCVRTETADPHALAAAIESLGPDDWLVITSRHGADAVAQ